MIKGKVIINGKINLGTGLHVGASRETMKIGGIDSPVVRDPITDYPYIPGSSLKGKLRSLWERANEGKKFKWKEEKEETITYNLVMDEIKRHECDALEKAKICPICRIFGSAKGNFPSRIIVRDMYLTKKSENDLKEIDTGLKYTEWKFENVLDRITAQATPRQIERIPAGSVFEFEIIYDVEDKDTAKEDLKNIQKAIELLEDDYLGGQGSRGYGKVKFLQDKITVKKIEYYLSGDENTKKEFTNLEGAITFCNTIE